MTNIKKLKNDINKLKNLHKAIKCQRFFKTGKGEYGHGDKFLGITTPELRKLSRIYKTLDRESILQLLSSPWHEERLLALFILVLQYKNADKQQQDNIYNLYIENYQYINNWDLVDSSAHYIIGAHLLNQDKKLIRDWCVSSNLWQRRMAVVATFHFIKNNQYSEMLKCAKVLLNDQEDLIHKSVGWMLREIGKRDSAVLEAFLNRFCKKMPRTMLRYAIEKFPENVRQSYLKR